MVEPSEGGETELSVHNILFTMPRTASHLLTKLLNLPAQPSLHRPSNNEDGYLFLPAAIQRFRNDLPGKRWEHWTEEEKTGLRKAFRQGFEEWTKLISEAESTVKSTYIKEHLNWLVDVLAEARLFGYDTGHVESFQVDWRQHTNDPKKSKLNATCIPDEFLIHHVRPTFLIRHPILTFPSSLRTAIDNEGLETVLKAEKTQSWECTFQWTYDLYHFYIQQHDFDRRSNVESVTYPIVLDAVNLGNEQLVKLYARAIGLDEEEVSSKWEAATENEVKGLGKVERRMKSTLLRSKGVDKGKLSIEGTADLHKLGEEWKREFGEVLSNRLFRLVEESTAIYEELRRARLTV